MKTTIRAFILTGCCTAIGCTWSGPHKLVYSDCMDQMLAYEEDLVGSEGEVFFKGMDKSDYCWQVAREQTRELKRRGILVNKVARGYR